MLTQEVRITVFELTSPEKNSACKKLYTYADYCRLPEGSPYQLIGGELVLVPSPSPYHQYISIRLVHCLVSFVTAYNLGVVFHAPIDVCLEETETYQPDIIFISKSRISLIEPQRINGAPDLVIEILSPATAYYDLRKKFKVYERCGVREYWIVDPEERSVQVFILRDGKFCLYSEAEKTGEISSAVFSNFSVSLEDIFSGWVV